MPSMMIVGIGPDPTADVFTIELTMQDVGEGNTLIGDAPFVPGYDLFAITDADGHTWTMDGNSFHLRNAPAGDIRITATYFKQA
jgi:hypothetical protein